MRSLVLSMGVMTLIAAGTAWAQAPAGGGGAAPQIPYGQTFKDFQFPIYNSGELKATIAAITAKGVTLNRAEATELKIEVYDQGKVTTTITSPQGRSLSGRPSHAHQEYGADRTRDMEATAQSCDFDQTNKKYLLRENVRVVLKNFDAGIKRPSTGTPSPPPPSSSPIIPAAGAAAGAPSSPGTVTLPPVRNDASPDIPGSYANTNVAPTPPSPPSTVTP